MKSIQIFIFFFIIVSLAVLFANAAKIQGILRNEVSVNIDTLALNNDIFESDSIVVKVDTITNQSFLMLQGAENSFSNFFNSLSHTNDSIIRIIYYGDSQIEGDHLTYTLRQNLQAKFGGSGIGFMPFEMYYNTTENMAIVTDDFEKSIVTYSNNIQDAKFGIYGRYFTPENKESKVKIVNRKKRHNFTQVKIIYSGEADLQVDIGNGIEERSLVEKHIGIDTLKFETSPDHIKLKFDSLKQFKAYGFLFDSEKGIAVDDVSFRGNLNLMVNHFDGNNFKEMGAMLKPSLVILHFGLNVIPDLRENYNTYQIAVERDIQLLKQYLPNCSILLIGVSDMAHKVEGELVAYSNIKQIIEAQKLAAKNEQVAFWDLRLAMGGEGVIIDWVNKDWARTDYAHMTFEGSEHIGNLLSNDLLNAYQQYLKENE